MFICVPWTLQPSVQWQLLVGQTEILLLHWMGYNKHRWKILVCAETTWVNKLGRKPRTCAQNCREGLCLPRQMLTVLWPGPQNCPVLFSCSYKFGKIMLRVGKAVKNLIPAMKTWNALKSMGQVCKNGWQNLNEAGRLLWVLCWEWCHFTWLGSVLRPAVWAASVFCMAQRSQVPNIFCQLIN